MFHRFKLQRPTLMVLSEMAACVAAVSVDSTNSCSAAAAAALSSLLLVVSASVAASAVFRQGLN